MDVLIRNYQSADATALADIFYDAVHQTAFAYYSEPQIRAWAPLPRDYAAWQTRLERVPPYVGLLAGKIVGFITLEPNGHIDLMYTHPEVQRQGVGTALYNHLEKIARDQSIPRLFVEASHVARPFFAKQQFQVVRPNQVQVRGETLANWIMEKRLS